MVIKCPIKYFANILAWQHSQYILAHIKMVTFDILYLLELFHSSIKNIPII